MIVRDGGWTLFDHDFASGRSVWHMFDGEKDVFRVDYPVENIVRTNETTRNATAGNSMGDWVKVASVPLNLAYGENLVRAQSEGDTAYVRRWLNDSNNRAWRSFEAHL